MPNPPQLLRSARPRHRLPFLPVCVALTVLMVGCLMLSLMVGQVKVPFANISRAVLHKILPMLVSQKEETDGSIVDERLPRAVLAAFVGAALSVCGVALQGLLGNSLADPYTIGVSAGAAVGAAFAILLHLGGVLGVALPFGSAAATMLFVFGVSRVGGRLQMASFLLSGVAVGSMLWSVVTLILLIGHTDKDAILRWLSGRLDGAYNWHPVLLVAPFTVLAVVLLTRSGRSLDAFTFGEETARSVGVDVERFKVFVLALVALVTAVTVSVAGIIGFVGLVTPHIARALVGPPHRTLILVSALVGAILTVCADVLARTVVHDNELPVGIITALLGAPFFFVLLRRQLGR